MVHVTLRLVDADGVQELVHPGHAKRADVEHLGVAALEQRRAVRGREKPDLGGKRPYVGRAASVDADALFDDALADDLLRVGASGGTNLPLAFGELGGELGDDLGGRRVERAVALGLGRYRIRSGETSGSRRGDTLVDIVAVVDEQHEVDGLLRTGLAHQLSLQLDRLPDPRLGDLETVRDDVLGHQWRALFEVLERPLGAAGLHHDDGHLSSRLLAERPSGHDQLEGGGVTLLVSGMREPRPLCRVRDADGTDRAVEGDARDHESGRGGVDRQHVVGVQKIGAEDCSHDVDLVAEAFGERRPQRPVDEAASQDRLVGRPALSAEERPGDLAGCVHPLFDVDGERKEVGALTHFSSSCRGGENDGVADPGDYSTIRLTG